jgi:hypothetical protein
VRAGRPPNLPTPQDHSQRDGASPEGCGRISGPLSILLCASENIMYIHRSRSSDFLCQDFFSALLVELDTKQKRLDHYTTVLSTRKRGKRNTQLCYPGKQNTRHNQPQLHASASGLSVVARGSTPASWVSGE